MRDPTVVQAVNLMMFSAQAPVAQVDRATAS